MIPIAKPMLTEEEMRDVTDVLKSGYLRQGAKTEEFEKEFCRRVGSRYAIAVNSGTAALHISYLSLLKPGDEAIVPAFTHISTASTVVYSNARPIFADIGEETFTMDPQDVNDKISSKTKVIAPVHLFGHAADMKTLGEIADDNDLHLVNDAAQAHGTRIDGRDVGALDDLNCYSFYPSKNMTTGEGGMVTTKERKLYEQGRLIRSHGQKRKYYHTTFGLNYRMTEIAAVIGLNQLERLHAFVEKRRHNAEVLTKAIEKIGGIRPPVVKSNVDHSFNVYSALMDLSQFKCGRNEFVKALQAENIGCRVHYPIPLTKQPAFVEDFKVDECPRAESISKKILSLPVHPLLKKTDLEKIIEAVELVVDYYRK
ncbi:MAG: DegT/DnrJ/EryC1/StrS family aminotransferase [Candidatus Bathyarchaeota archaeon]|nr:MAG: DegT/DnrJ/EryC1/StrS family aminotransferase [Candidatus Bathyarchaeota archaeon]